jgi:hypothetical protein
MSATMVRFQRALAPNQVDDAFQLFDARALAKLELMAGEIEDIGSAATSQPITTIEGAGQAAELIARGVIAIKELEALRRSHTDPLNVQVKTVNGIFKRLTEPLEQLVGRGGRLEKLILAFRMEERKKREREEAELRRKQEAAAKAEADALAKAEAAKSEAARKRALEQAAEASRQQTDLALATTPPITKGVRTDSGSVTEREVWIFEVVKPTEVPREYLCVDEAQIRAAVKAGVRQIPGVNIYPEDRLTRRVG